jgi:uncharacterized protein
MNWLMRFMLRLYQRWISPALPHSCRFVPTCSEYAMDAINRHGAVGGSVMAVARLLRCHPFARAGYDPVPLNPRVSPASLRMERKSKLG